MTTSFGVVYAASAVPALESAKAPTSTSTIVRMALFIGSVPPKVVNDGWQVTRGRRGADSP